QAARDGVEVQADGIGIGFRLGELGLEGLERLIKVADVAIAESGLVRGPFGRLDGALESVYRSLIHRWLLSGVPASYYPPCECSQTGCHHNEKNSCRCAGDSGCPRPGLRSGSGFRHAVHCGGGKSRVHTELAEGGAPDPASDLEARA